MEAFSSANSKSGAFQGPCHSSILPFAHLLEDKHGSVFGTCWSLKKTKLRQAARLESNTQHMFTGL